MDPLWIASAFVLGFLAKQIGLPPLVGFLATGFLLNLAGVEGSEMLDQIAHFGVLLLLFSIGLKLNIKSLLKPEIWATASLHLLITVVIFSTICFVLSIVGLSLFAGLDVSTSLLIAFALSFSSTVFAVKILEEKGEMLATHGRIAIGILIMQDIFAVIFLTFSTGKIPSPWALALIGLFIVPRLLKMKPVSAILIKSGHGELMVLLGVLIPFAGAALFEIVNLKPDLGALIFGILLAGHPKANEISNAMLSFKDLFLVGFFLTIGLAGIPDLQAWGVALLLTLVLPLKVVLYFLLLIRFKLRARTATLASLNLANYSEFGLIVGAAGAANGWLSSEWLVIFALALSLTFVLASPLNVAANQLYTRLQPFLRTFETEERLPEDERVEIGGAEVIIFGMGRVGTQVYHVMQEKFNGKVLGIDCNKEVVFSHLSENRNVIHGDATDIDFWQRVEPSPSIRLIILATSNHLTHMEVVRQFKEFGTDKMIAALSRYKDEMAELKAAGVQIVFNLYAEAGAGYAEHVYQTFSEGPR